MSPTALLDADPGERILLQERDLPRERTTDSPASVRRTGLLRTRRIRPSCSSSALSR
ncbi:hypothetical protein AB1285_21340 [Microbacterium sp. NRRL B-14842]|uniref:hypothetical protein n=1 Tax=Microbacterium sp. NRRL B-14842 TaxID=3162881 RepID=UPI003D28045E